MAASDSSQFLSRDQLSGMKNVFLMSPGNKDFLLGTSKRRPGVTTLLAPLLLLVLCAIIAGCPMTAAASATSGAGVLWLSAVVLAALFLVAIVITYRNYQRDQRFDAQGKLLPVTITDVTTRERSEAATKGLRILGVIEFILDVLDSLSSTPGGRASSRRLDNDANYQPRDFFEVTIVYAATSPTGKQISGTVKDNRPELRGSLPGTGDPMIVLYLDDRNYKLM